MIVFYSKLLLSNAVFKDFLYLNTNYKSEYKIYISYFICLQDIALILGMGPSCVSAGAGLILLMNSIVRILMNVFSTMGMDLAR